MNVDFIQYMRPDGRQKPTQCLDIKDDLRPNYELMQQAGLNFAAEVLMSGMVSLTIEDRVREEDVQILVVPNGPAVPRAVESLLSWCTPENIGSYLEGGS